MSEKTPAERSKHFAARTIALLKEYREKFESVSNQLFAIQEAGTDEKLDSDKRHILRFKHSSLAQLNNSIRPAATQLAREVSQRIEHGDLDELDRVELRLRLAEFEHSLQSLQQVSSWGF